jgi:hypothetical protein
MDASPIPVSMSNDSELASRWFGPFAMASPTTPAEKSNGENQTARISLTVHFLSPERLD